MPEPGATTPASAAAAAAVASGVSIAAIAVAAWGVTYIRRGRRCRGVQAAAAPRKQALAQMATELRLAQVTSQEDARRLAGTARWRALLRAAVLDARGKGRPLGLAVYPGSFNPPSRVHVEVVKQVSALPTVDGVWLDMTAHRAKKLYIDSVKIDRARMADCAVDHLMTAGATDLMAQMGDRGWGKEYFATLRELLKSDGDSDMGPAKLVWVMGSDVVEGMSWWAEKARELLRYCDELVVIPRKQAAGSIVETLEGVLGSSRDTLEAEGFTITVLKFDDASLEEVSSSAIRRYLVSLLQLVPLCVLQYIVMNRHLIDFYTSLYNEVDVQASMRQAQGAFKRTKSRY